MILRVHPLGGERQGFLTLEGIGFEGLGLRLVEFGVLRAWVYCSFGASCILLVYLGAPYTY
jgi:hypothetical protein